MCLDRTEPFMEHVQSLADEVHGVMDSSLPAFGAQQDGPQRFQCSSFFIELLLQFMFDHANHRLIPRVADPKKQSARRLTEDRMQPSAQCLAPLPVSFARLHCRTLRLLKQGASCS